MMNPATARTVAKAEQIKAVMRKKQQKRVLKAYAKSIAKIKTNK